MDSRKVSNSRNLSFDQSHMCMIGRVWKMVKWFQKETSFGKDSLSRGLAVSTASALSLIF